VCGARRCLPHTRHARFARRVNLSHVARLRRRANQWPLFARPARTRGASRSSGNVGRDAMDVLARMTSAAGACGKTAWSCPPDAGVKFAKMICERRWLQSPVHRGERGISLKPLRREYLWSLPPAFLLQAGHGCGLHPAFPAPSVFRGTTNWQSSGKSCRENAGSCHSMP
jgi:hypothetical protein